MPSRPGRVVPGALVWSSLGLALVILVVSAYLTYEHFSSSATLACPEGQVLNCARVTESEWAMVGPVPVAVLGLVFAVAMVALCLPAAWRRVELDVVRLSAAAVGVAMVLHLVWAELFAIHAICLWCTVVHVATVALFAVLVVGRALLPTRR